MPMRLLERYNEALADPELISLHDDIALTEARIEDLLKRVDSGESGKLWHDLNATWEAFQQARTLGDTETMAVHLATLGTLIPRGAADYGAWHEITAALEQKRKLADSERKRLVEMEQMVTAGQAMNAFSAIIESIRTHVHDRTTLAALSADLARIANHARSTGDSPRRLSH